ncbi:MAG: hypothetical protein A2822_02280 [Candidatus Staskawiczbacteria bacterium RIFCSPHIGHO2_01_FULL_41_41]|uniref:Reverse transcriptase domain-containing protein n=1 Tax=Candidatus Staskawiczbacteria bacterium RIFCSPHIGHO2_01_FULL_41_41 TaxID=1802203 RepID=A0A1G2HWS0_9BACT|nr:MAG: hypothetical protein A2822_02280 [Candidatus Staskawiczbacteria bacterium RIFCSPHIGHO2_01_FULL_41_41]OGZ74420.1 MAG: hypothetical protein A3A12_01470 [Candidatus Staskawiczbacteria bacterium RIFCSPLOWO2_01_FULL_43_17b]
MSHSIFEEITSVNNLFLAWDEFRRGKRAKADVQLFEYNLETDIFKLNKELRDKTYWHSPYFSFYVKDPKIRHIHKACVKDRVLHHAIFRVLYPLFDKSFIFDSYSCRNEKGTHRALKRLNVFLQKVSKNNTELAHVLKCDVRKFFDSVDQDILMGLVKNKIQDPGVLWLLQTIVSSFEKGLPLGNVVSQLFSNIYLNELDQFVKHVLKVKYYIRYCDDFVIIESSAQKFESYKSQIDAFLKNRLKLALHPNKIIVRKYYQGIDFLGYVSFPHHKIVRVKTKNRMIEKLKTKVKELQGSAISEDSFNKTLQSYLGVLTHCNSYELREEILKLI